jgi:hypothetical protein
MVPSSRPHHPPELPRVKADFFILPQKCSCIRLAEASVSPQAALMRPLYGHKAASSARPAFSGGVARADERKRRIDRLARPRIFDREPRLTDPPETLKRDWGALGAQERCMQVGKVFIAAGEQAAERQEGKIAGFVINPASAFLRASRTAEPRMRATRLSAPVNGFAG